MTFKDINWSKDDVLAFDSYLKSFQNLDRVEWTKRIVNTKLDVLAIKANDIKRIVNNIKQSNIKAYLDLEMFYNHELTIIYSSIIFELNDFDEIVAYLNKLLLIGDNWATCDSIPFKKIFKKNQDKLFALALKYIKSDNWFTRRVGIKIFFEYKNQDNVLPQIFDAIIGLYDENEYYVNMIISWLLCELFINKREEAINFLDKHKINEFVVKKMISKCRDSFRVSDADKAMLLEYRK